MQSFETFLLKVCHKIVLRLYVFYFLQVASDMKENRNDDKREEHDASEESLQFEVEYLKRIIPARTLRPRLWKIIAQYANWIPRDFNLLHHRL